MSRRYPELLLDDMLESIDAIERYTQGMNEEAIMASSLHKDAIIRNLEILGEAANQLTKEIGSFMNIMVLTGRLLSPLLLKNCLL
ncbi:MAG: DUF86 domain-containing protein [Vampirovibrio sp.]|nr:DUF86 domain-containing protein [Vampirovibrio sp.]